MLKHATANTVVQLVSRIFLAFLNVFVGVSLNILMPYLCITNKLNTVCSHQAQPTFLSKQFVSSTPTSVSKSRIICLCTFEYNCFKFGYFVSYSLICFKYYFLKIFSFFFKFLSFYLFQSSSLYMISISFKYFTPRLFVHGVCSQNMFIKQYCQIMHVLKKCTFLSANLKTIMYNC